MKSCLHCGGPVVGISRKVLCSPRCKCAYFRARNPGKVATYSANVPRYTKVKACECGAYIRAAFKRCDACFSEKNRRHAKAYDAAKHVSQSHKCKRCDSVFVTAYADKRRTFCSSKCMKADQRARVGSRTHRARARRYGVPYEPINPTTVFDRDGWTCQVCGTDTPKGLRGSRYSCAPELGHIVAVSLGGPHTYANVQCECRRCNNHKGALPDADRLLKAMNKRNERFQYDIEVDPALMGGSKSTPFDHDTVLSFSLRQISTVHVSSL